MKKVNLYFILHKRVKFLGGGGVFIILLLFPFILLANIAKREREIEQKISMRESKSL